MQYDEIIDCPKSGGNLCYKIEVSKDITNYFSLSCGFWTNSLMTPNSDFYKDQMALLPELYKDLFYTDEEGKTWMPSSVNLPQQGMVFANGPDSENWAWSAVKAVPVLEEEKTKYPIPGQPGKYYEWRMDMTTIKHFPERDYMEALTYIGVLPS
jgi:hypothetical protein